MKNLPAGMERYIAKKVDKAWRVYDKARGSFPYRGGDAGTVQQDTSEELAIAEAARLNGVTAEDVTGKSIELKDGGQPRTKETKTTEMAEEIESVELDELLVSEEDIADYGLMSAEDRAAYEDGLMEKVTY